MRKCGNTEIRKYRNTEIQKYGNTKYENRKSKIVNLK